MTGDLRKSPVTVRDLPGAAAALLCRVLSRLGLGCAPWPGHMQLLIVLVISLALLLISLSALIAGFYLTMQSVMQFDHTMQFDHMRQLFDAYVLNLNMLLFADWWVVTMFVFVFYLNMQFFIVLVGSFVVCLGMLRSPSVVMLEPRVRELRCSSSLSPNSPCSSSWTCSSSPTSGAKLVSDQLLHLPLYLKGRVVPQGHPHHAGVAMQFKAILFVVYFLLVGWNVLLLRDLRATLSAMMLKPSRGRRALSREQCDRHVQSGSSWTLLPPRASSSVTTAEPSAGLGQGPSSHDASASSGGGHENGSPLHVLISLGVSQSHRPPS